MTNSEKLNKMLYTFFLADDGIYNEERIFSYLRCNASISTENSFSTFYYMSSRCSLNLDCIGGELYKVTLFPDSYNSDVPFLSIDRHDIIMGGLASSDGIFIYNDCTPTSTELKRIGMDHETLDLLNFILIKFRPIMETIHKKLK